jgi:hypothetical protein
VKLPSKSATALRASLRCAAPLIACVLWVSGARGQVKHWNMGATDRVAECASEILKHRVLITVPAPKLDPSICDGANADELRRRFKSAGARLVSNEKWIWVFGAATVAQPEGASGKSLQLVVETQLRTDSLSNEEQEELLKLLTAQTRFVPISAYPFQQQADGSWQVSIVLGYEVHEMPGGSAETAKLAVIHRQSNEAGYNRLIFVEERDGKLDIKWDSGELDAQSVGLEFDDILGNGKQQIVATGEVTEDVGEPSLDVFAMFDTEGNELTRQEECPGAGHFRAEQMVCPIQGNEVSLVTDKHPWAIEVKNSAGEGQQEKVTHFHFVTDTGRYAAVATPKPPSNQ